MPNEKEVENKLIKTRLASAEEGAADQPSTSLTRQLPGEMKKDDDTSRQAHGLSIEKIQGLDFIFRNQDQRPAPIYLGFQGSTAEKIQKAAKKHFPALNIKVQDVKHYLNAQPDFSLRTQPKRIISRAPYRQSTLLSPLEVSSRHKEVVVCLGWVGV